MSNVRTEFGFKRTECACEECIQFCYARLWILLHSMGLVAPSPIEARERMRREAQEKKKRAGGMARKA